jgi:hypothetical protein
VQHVCIVPQLLLTTPCGQTARLVAAFAQQHVGTRKTKASLGPAVCTDSTDMSQRAHKHVPPEHHNTRLQRQRFRIITPLPCKHARTGHAVTGGSTDVCLVSGAARLQGTDALYHIRSQNQTEL